MSFSIVIPTRGRPELLEDTLASLDRCGPAPAEVIVVDGDESRSAEPVVAAHPNVRYLTSEPSLTRQRNVGLDAVTHDLVLFLDDDVVVDPVALAELARAYEDDGVVGATGVVDEPASRRFGSKQAGIRRLLLPGREGTFTRSGYPRYVLDTTRARDVEVMQGCFMSARLEAARQLRFDEHLTGYGLAEDEDFSYRLSRLGRIRFVPGARVVHRKTGFASHDPRAFSRLAAANRTYLFRKNFPQTLAARVQFGMLMLVLVAHRLVNREWKGALGLLEGAVRAWRTRSA